MKALVLERTASIMSNPLSLRERDLRSPEPGEVSLEVLACAVSARDLEIIEGKYAPEGLQLPLVPGHQVVGLVRELGLGAQLALGALRGRSLETGALRGRSLETGARVGLGWLNDTCGGCEACQRSDESACKFARFTGYNVDGGFCTEMIAPAAFIHAIPEHLSDVEAASLLGGERTRAAVRAGLAGAAAPEVEVFDLDQANDALSRARESAVVLVPRS